MVTNQDDFKPDSVVEAVIQRFHDRAKFGKDKYGTDLDRNDLTMEEWIRHAQDEAHDFILYLEKMKQLIQRFK